MVKTRVNDLTLLYYTANTVSDYCAKRVRRHLLEITKAQFPLVSVSQKPLNFGENICVGSIGKSYYNCYKQIFTGAKAVKTKYINGLSTIFKTSNIFDLSNLLGFSRF